MDFLMTYVCISITVTILLPSVVPFHSLWFNSSLGVWGLMSPAKLHECCLAPSCSGKSQLPYVQNDHVREFSVLHFFLHFSDFHVPSPPSSGMFPEPWRGWYSCVIWSWGLNTHVSLSFDPLSVSAINVTLCKKRLTKADSNYPTSCQSLVLLAPPPLPSPF